MCVLQDALRIYALISVYLTFYKGNLEFVEGPESAQVSNTDLLNTIAELLDVDPAEAEKTLCARVVAARGEVMQKGHTVQEASHGRDAFAKVPWF